eukprot:8551019-Pyramimonas_sp.AAC.1
MWPRNARAVRRNGAGPPPGPSVELPTGPRSAVLSGGRMWTPPVAFDGAPPYGATKRCFGRGRRMRTPPLRPLVESPMGSRRSVRGGGDECEHRR